MRSIDAELAPIRRAPLYEEVAERLQSLIAGRQLAPGDRLPSERELSQRLGVSRTSVRQGLTALRSIGLIDVRHGDGAYLVRAADEVVSPMALAMLNAEADHSMVWEAREALEVHAARLAAERATPDDIARMEAALQAMRAAVEAGEDGTAADSELHETIVEAAHNPMLAELFRGIREAVTRTSEASLSMPGRPPDSLRAHAAIVEAIGDHDGARAASEMTSHLRSCARSFAAPVQV